MDRDLVRNGAIYHRLLALLLLLMALHPVGPGGGGVIGRLTLAAVLVGCIWSVAAERRLLAVGLSLGVPAVALLALPGSPGGIVGPALVLCTLLFICGVLLGRVLRHPVITSGSLSAALVVYLLIGLIWYQAYMIVEHLQPGSFYGVSAASGIASAKELYYYSFVTLTTLGYGDMGPVSEQARSLAITEAVVGQLYLAVLVASLVGRRLSAQRNGDVSSRSAPSADSP